MTSPTYSSAPLKPQQARRLGGGLLANELGLCEFLNLPGPALGWKKKKESCFGTPHFKGSIQFIGVEGLKSLLYLLGSGVAFMTLLNMYSGRLASGWFHQT